GDRSSSSTLRPCPARYCSRFCNAAARSTGLVIHSTFYLGLTPQALCCRRLRRLVGLFRQRQRYRTGSGSDLILDSSWMPVSARYRSRFCISFATSERFSDRCSPDRMSLIATSPRARSSSPAIATKEIPRAEAYLNCLPILSASG